MRLAVDREIRGAPSLFEPFGPVSLFSGRTLRPADLAETDVLFVRSVTRVDAALLDGTPVRYVGTATAGTDHLDLDYLNERGIAAFDAAGCNARAVAEYVLAAALLVGPFAVPGARAPSVGIIGYGHVGKQVAELFAALGADCVINDPPLAESHPDLAAFAPIEAALACDIVTLHVPLTRTGPHPSADLLGARELDLIRDDALLLNAARGGVIDETALLVRADGRALNLTIDCWAGEPGIDRDLAQRANLATPHIAGHTIEARARAAMILREVLAARTGAHLPAAGEADEPTVLEPNPAVDDPFAPLRESVLACCDPRATTDALRATLTLDEPARRAAFDQLRRDAAGRREFSHYRIASAGLAPDTVRALGALGFHTNEA